MFKHSKLLIVTAVGVFLFAMASILFAEVGAQSEEGINVDNANTQASAQKQTSPYQERRQQIQQRRAKAKQLRQEDKAGTRTERIKLRGQNVLDRTSIRVDRMSKIADKIEEISARFAEKGIDVNEVTDLLQTARESFGQASNLQKQATDTLAKLNTAEDLPAVIKDFKTQILNIYQVLGQGRQNLIQAIKKLKAAKPITAK
jgi:hypothetical protein